MGALKNYVELSDLEIRCSQGDAEALATYWDENELYFRNFLFHKFYLRTEAQNDILQDSFIHVAEKLGRGLYLPTKGASLRTWIVKSMQNLTIDYLRRKHKNPAAPNKGIEDENGKEVAVYFEIIGTERTHEDGLIGQENAIFMKKLVAKLPPPFERIIRLRYYKGMKYEDIADRTGIPLGTVKGHLYRAKSLLRDLYKKYGRE